MAQGNTGNTTDLDKTTTLGNGFPTTTRYRNLPPSEQQEYLRIWRGYLAQNNRLEKSLIAAQTPKERADALRSYLDSLRYREHDIDTMIKSPAFPITRILVVEMEKDLIAQYRSRIALRYSSLDLSPPASQTATVSASAAPQTKVLTDDHLDILRESVKWGKNTGYRGWLPDALADKERRIERLIQDADPRHLGLFKGELLRIAMYDAKAELEKRAAWAAPKAAFGGTSADRPKIGGAAWKDVWKNDRHIVNHIIFLNEQAKIADRRVAEWEAAGRPETKRAPEGKTSLWDRMTGFTQKAGAALGLTKTAAPNALPPVDPEGVLKEEKKRTSIRGRLSGWKETLSRQMDNVVDALTSKTAIRATASLLGATVLGMGVMIAEKVYDGAADANVANAPTATVAFAKAAAPAVDVKRISLNAETPADKPKGNVDYADLIEQDLQAFEGQSSGTAKPAAPEKVKVAKASLKRAFPAPVAAAEVAVVATVSGEDTVNTNVSTSAEGQDLSAYIAAHREVSALPDFSASFDTVAISTAAAPHDLDLQEARQAVEESAAGTDDIGAGNDSDSTPALTLESFDAEMNAYNRAMLDRELEELRNRPEQTLASGPS
jgi:hypothetical protein